MTTRYWCWAVAVTIALAVAGCAEEGGSSGDACRDNCPSEAERRLCNNCVDAEGEDEALWCAASWCASTTCRTECSNNDRNEHIDCIICDVDCPPHDCESGGTWTEDECADYYCWG